MTKYVKEGAWAAAKIDGQVVGAPDRSPLFESNHWEHVVHRVDHRLAPGHTKQKKSY
ncbi:MAG: hypothetical protein WCY58_10760 [Mariniphaga sp.]|nr:hypothetical protein [Mariniphaga sp.]MDD4227207.1 hypothetical protein [Mariniphaga sp.]MDD4425331.1 hypothetical protein [Mariniphaga sp.]